MAQTLLDLIRRGSLAQGTELTHLGVVDGRRSVTAVAEVVGDGLRVKTRTFSSPSAAAKAITGRPVDGWLFWRLPGGAYLASLRSPRRSVG